MITEIWMTIWNFEMKPDDIEIMMSSDVSDVCSLYGPRPHVFLSQNSMMWWKIALTFGVTLIDKSMNASWKDVTFSLKVGLRSLPKQDVTTRSNARNARTYFKHSTGHIDWSLSTFFRRIWRYYQWSFGRDTTHIPHCRPSAYKYEHLAIPKQGRHRV